MRYKKRYYREPKEINAGYNSICSETGKEIKAGEICIYYPAEKKVFHTDSKTAQAFREMKFDNEILNCNY